MKVLSYSRCPTMPTASACFDKSISFMFLTYTRVHKVLSEGTQLENGFFVVFLFMKEEMVQYNYKWAIIGPPAKRHLNGVLLAGR